jgi:hypothetical protein
VGNFQRIFDRLRAEGEEVLANVMAEARNGYERDVKVLALVSQMNRTRLAREAVYSGTVAKGKTKS